MRGRHSGGLAAILWTLASLGPLLVPNALFKRMGMPAMQRLLCVPFWIFLLLLFAAQIEVWLFKR